MGLASFRLLGPVEVWREGRLVDVGHARQRLVLAALLVQANRVVPADRLAGWLWGDDPPATSVDLVYGYVSRLRRRLGGAAGLVRVPGGYRLEADPESIDLHRFRRLVAAARSAADDERAAASFATGLGLWRGTALTGVTGQWAEGVRLTLEAERAAAMVDHGEVGLRLGADAALLGDLRGLLAGQPFDERAAGLFMRAAYQCGRRAEALECYHQLRVRLAEEVGVEPGLELQELFQRLLRDDPALEGPGGLPRRPPVPEVAEVRYSLPPDTAAFTGRDGELAVITAAVADAAGAGGVVGIHAIGGMPGVGKTALAVHAAHRLREEFADRQLFIDLHGHSPGRDPVPPEDALAGLLSAWGVDARSLPADLAGRAGLWRDKMAGQRALLVLDNAAGSAQVTPLLPGGDGCLVLVTSRRHLGDLPGPVTAIPVDVLAPGQAREMFTRLARRAAADPAEAVDELARLAGGLPLAISLLARVYARHPSWTLVDLATETEAGVLALAAENDSVAAAFDLSYRYLTPARQRFFRRLGLHPGSTTDAYAAAALADVPLAEAAVLLDALHGEGLLTEVSYRRYGMHDLIRRYAQDLAAADPAAGRDQAVDRLLVYYQHAAATAQALLARQSRTTPAPTAPTAPPAAVPDMPDRERALAWARAERGNLLACLDHATRAGQHAQVVAHTAAAAALLRQDGPWAEAITRHDTAVQAARHLGDQMAEGNALSDLGDVLWLTGDYPGAARALGAALDIYGDLGDRLGEGNVLYELGIVRQLTGDYPGAARALGAALDIYRDLGNRLGEGNALNQLGIVRQLTGDFRSAGGAFGAALSIYRDLGDRLGQGNALNDLGIVRRLTGDYPGAAWALEEALDIYRDLGNRLGQAGALRQLGALRRLTGDYPGAAWALEEALDIYRDLGNRLGQAGALSQLGAVRRLTGDYPRATGALEEALDICRDLGEPGGEAEVLNEAGTLHRVRGDLDEAGACHRQALRIACQIGSSWDEACALAGLGRCALAAGDTASAQASLRQAQEIFRSIGAAEASGVTAELSALTKAEPAAETR